MEKERINAFLLSKAKYFPIDVLEEIQMGLAKVPDEKAYLLNAIEFLDPNLINIVSLFAGMAGVDRFLIGSVGMALLKLITCGGFGFVYLYDICTMKKKTKNRNYELITDFIYSYSKK